MAHLVRKVRTSVVADIEYGIEFPRLWKVIGVFQAFNLFLSRGDLSKMGELRESWLEAIESECPMRLIKDIQEVHGVKLKAREKVKVHKYVVWGTHRVKKGRGIPGKCGIERG